MYEHKNFELWSSQVNDEVQKNQLMLNDFRIFTTTSNQGVGRKRMTDKEYVCCKCTFGTIYSNARYTIYFGYCASKNLMMLYATQHLELRSN